MSVNALTSQGVQLKIGDAASPEVFTAIPEIVTFNGPGGAGQVIDVTDLDSAAMEKIMGLPDEGQLSFDINYLPDNTYHTLLRTNRGAQTLTNFKLVFTDGSPVTTWSFAGYITGFTVTGGVNATIRAAVTIEITGAITES